MEDFNLGKLLYKNYNMRSKVKYIFIYLLALLLPIYPVYHLLQEPGTEGQVKALFIITSFTLAIITFWILGEILAYTSIHENALVKKKSLNSTSIYFFEHSEYVVKLDVKVNEKGLYVGHMLFTYEDDEYKDRRIQIKLSQEKLIDLIKILMSKYPELKLSNEIDFKLYNEIKEVFK